MFCTAFVLCILRLFKLKTKAKQPTQKSSLQIKLPNSNQNFAYAGLT